MPLPACTRIDFDDEAGRAKLLADGWREIEVLETWHGPSPRGAGLATYRAEKADIPRLQEIARAAFTEDRLHKDQTVAKEEADAAKEKWVADAVMDYRRTVLIQGDPIAGFLSYFLADDTVIIDLLAVHPDSHHKHIGSSLMIAACHDAKFVRAGTQATNEAARRLYDSMGMSVIMRERTFHRP